MKNNMSIKRGVKTLIVLSIMSCVYIVISCLSLLKPYDENDERE